MKFVKVVGVGALGSHVIQFLRNEEIELSVIDFDRVEQRNTQAQFHAKTGIRKLKVQCASQLMKFLWGVKIQAIPTKLTSDNVEELLGMSDLVLDCLDNAASRELIQNYVQQNKIPCLHGALAPDGSFGRIIWTDKFKIDTEDVEGAKTCEGGEFLPFIAITAAYMSYAAQMFLREGKKVGFQIHPNGVTIV